MAWQFTKRHQETLWDALKITNGSKEGVKRQGAWSVGETDMSPPAACRGHCRPNRPIRLGWRSWLQAVLCVVGLAVGMESGAQTESAPFVFESSAALRIDTPGWVSERDYVVATPAYIDVAPGVQAHILGSFSPAPGSWGGLYKLGGGTLKLSGAVSYLGSTQLLQGGLHVDGPQVFGMWGALEAAQGTQLEYSPGTEVSRALTVRSLDVSHEIPPDLYVPVAPPPGLENAMGWKVSGGTATHAGLLQGSLPFVKLGEGLLDITGDAMAYTGQARVAEGALAINEIFSGSVVVGANARLHGAGSVGAVHVEAGGTLAPGKSDSMSADFSTMASYSTAPSDSGAASSSVKAMSAAVPSSSIATFAVIGDLRFDPGSRFEVNATPAGQADHVWVGGQALLDGEVAVLAENGVWNTSTSYAIVSAQGGLADTRFASVSSNLAFLTPSLDYSADTVTLTLKRNETPIKDVGDTPDEKDVGDVIDDEGGNGGGGDGDPVDKNGPGPGADAGNDDSPGDRADNGGGVEESPGVEDPGGPGIHDQIIVMDEDNARKALKQLTGSWNASVLSSVWDDSRFIREAVLHQSAAMLGAASYSTPASSALSRSFAFTSPARHSARPAHLKVVSSPAASADSGAFEASASSLPSIAPADTAVAGATPLWTPWVEVFHSEQQRDSRAGVPADTRRIDGLALGVAAAVHRYWKAGAFFGAQNSRLAREHGAARADIHTIHAGLHLAGHVEGWRLIVGAARSWHRIKSSRLLQAGAWREKLGARYSGQTTQVFAEAAWPIEFQLRQLNPVSSSLASSSSTLGDAAASTAASRDARHVDLAFSNSTLFEPRSVESEFSESKSSGRALSDTAYVDVSPAANTIRRITLTPFIGAAWVRTGLDAFTEQGGVAALKTRPASMAGWVSTVGLRFEAALKAAQSQDEARVFAHLAWHHAKHNTARSTQVFQHSTAQTFFSSQGLAPARQSWSLRLGLDTPVGKASQIGFAYLGRHGSSLRDQGIGAWARIEF